MGDQAMVVQRRAAPAAGRFTPSPPGLLQRCGGVTCPPGTCDHDQPQLQRAAAGPVPDGVPPVVDEVLRSPGRPLDAATRADMEPRFGHDFSAVRVHDDARAARSAAAVAASAYTVGPHVVIGAGWQPGSPAGRRLLAHELTHVVQQRAGDGQAPPRRLEVGPPGTAAEREADQTAGSVLQGAAAPAPAAAHERLRSGTLSRQPRLGAGLPKVQTKREDFHDPNLCYRIETRDALHPDRTKVVAVMQAQIVTPSTCDGKVTLRTSVLQSDWGAAAATFEARGGGGAQGSSESVVRDEAGGRVDFEEQFFLDGCQAYFNRCHLITYDEGKDHFVFAEAFYQPRLAPMNQPSGLVIQDTTPAPELRVEPCDHLTATRCPDTRAAPPPSKGKAAPKPGKQPAPPGPKPKR